MKAVVTLFLQNKSYICFLFIGSNTSTIHTSNLIFSNVSNSSEYSGRTWKNIVRVPSVWSDCDVIVTYLKTSPRVLCNHREYPASSFLRWCVLLLKVRLLCMATSVCLCACCTTDGEARAGVLVVGVHYSGLACRCSPWHHLSELPFFSSSCT